MAHLPRISPEAETDPETHSRDGIGLSEATIRTPFVEDALRRLRRRNVRVHLSHRQRSQHRQHLGHSVDIPTVLIRLQLPPRLSRCLPLPRFRTDLGDSALYSPPSRQWERANGPDTLWRQLLIEAPEIDWKPTQPWVEVHLTITDPGSWLDALVHVIDEASAPKDAQRDLFG